MLIQPVPGTVGPPQPTSSYNNRKNDSHENRPWRLLRKRAYLVSDKYAVYIHILLISTSHTRNTLLVYVCLFVNSNAYFHTSLLLSVISTNVNKVTSINEVAIYNSDVLDWNHSGRCISSLEAKGHSHWAFTRRFRDLWLPLRATCPQGTRRAGEFKMEWAFLNRVIPLNFYITPGSVFSLASRGWAHHSKKPDPRKQTEVISCLCFILHWLLAHGAPDSLIPPCNTLLPLSTCTNGL